MRHAAIVVSDARFTKSRDPMSDQQETLERDTHSTRRIEHAFERKLA
jgi:hypothetical protein